jgi:hypothetical protein
VWLRFLIHAVAIMTVTSVHRAQTKVARKGGKEEKKRKKDQCAALKYE